MPNAAAVLIPMTLVSEEPFARMDQKEEEEELIIFGKFFSPLIDDFAENLKVVVLP